MAHSRVPRAGTQPCSPPHQEPPTPARSLVPQSRIPLQGPSQPSHPQIPPADQTPLLPNGLPHLHLDYLSLKRAVGSDQGPSSQPWSLAKHLVGALPKLNCPQPLGQGLPTPAPGRTGTFQPVSQCSGG